MNWTKLETPQDAERLLALVGGFHDGCIREMHLWTEQSVDTGLSMSIPEDLDTSLRLLVQMQFKNPSAVEMLFEQVTRVNVVRPVDNWHSIIFGSTLIQHENEWIWSPTDDWSPTSPERDRHTWVSARKLAWRDASDWMGHALRYGSTDENDGA